MYSIKKIKQAIISGELFEEIISKQEIEERIEDIAQNLYKKGFDKPKFLIVLKGAFMFGTELIKRYEGNCTIDFLKVSSYEGFKNSGEMKISVAIQPPNKISKKP